MSILLQQISRPISNKKAIGILTANTGSSLSHTICQKFLKKLNISKSIEDSNSEFDVELKNVITCRLLFLVNIEEFSISLSSIKCWAGDGGQG